jgi:hypothetical protein
VLKRVVVGVGLVLGSTQVPSSCVVGAVWVVVRRLFVLRRGRAGCGWLFWERNFGLVVLGAVGWFGLVRCWFRVHVRLSWPLSSPDSTLVRLGSIHVLIA